MVNSVKKWLEANHKGDGPIENIDEMAASRVKYTLPGIQSKPEPLLNH